MPFEGTGAVSSWQLEVGRQNFIPGETIDKVAVTLFYTAKYDRGQFRDAVKESMIKRDKIGA